MIDTFIAAFGLALGLIAAASGWVAARQSELRRDQVLDWANDGIESLQTLALLVKPQMLQIDEPERVSRIEAIGIHLSVLVEQGRLLFKNEPDGEFGIHKELAYRGVRPLVLDELVIAHQLACDWRGLSGGDKAWAFETSVVLLKRFVSLAQLEVGRDRTASVYTKQGGDGTSFQALLLAHNRGDDRVRLAIAPKRSRWQWLNWPRN